MGQAIAAGIAGADDLDLAGIWKRGEDLDSLVRPGDVIVVPRSFF